MRRGVPPPGVALPPARAEGPCRDALVVVVARARALARLGALPGRALRRRRRRGALRARGAGGRARALAFRPAPLRAPWFRPVALDPGLLDPRLFGSRLLGSRLLSAGLLGPGLAPA